MASGKTIAASDRDARGHARARGRDDLLKPAALENILPPEEASEEWKLRLVKVGQCWAGA